MPRKGGKKKSEVHGESSPESGTGTQAASNTKKNSPVNDTQEETENLSSEETQWLMNVIRNTARDIIDEKLGSGKMVNNNLSDLKREMTNEIKRLQDKVEQLETDLKKKSRRIERLEFENHQKECQIKTIKLQMDESEQHGYDHCLQLVGLPECKEDSDDTKQIIKMTKDKLGIKIKSNDLEEVKRLGKKRDTKMRNVEMKFKDKSLRDKVFECRKKSITDSNPKNNVYINDKLTRHRQSLLYAARNLVKSKKLFAAWAQHGNILVRKKEDSKIVEVKDHSDLSNIKEDNDPEQAVDNSEKFDQTSSSGPSSDCQSIITHLSNYSYYVDSDY